MTWWKVRFLQNLISNVLICDISNVEWVRHQKCTFSVFNGQVVPTILRELLFANELWQRYALAFKTMLAEFRQTIIGVICDAQSSRVLPKRSFVKRTCLKQTDRQRGVEYLLRTRSLTQNEASHLIQFLGYDLSPGKPLFKSVERFGSRSRHNVSGTSLYGCSYESFSFWKYFNAICDSSLETIETIQSSKSASQSDESFRNMSNP